MNLAERIEPHADQIVAEATEVISQARLHHYGASGEQVTSARLADLLEKVLDSVRSGSPLTVVEHAENVARERYEGGFRIDELQVAFNALEEALWRLLVREVPADELVESLGQLGAVLGAGKDQLARTYVALASRHHHPAIDVGVLQQGV